MPTELTTTDKILQLLEGLTYNDAKLALQSAMDSIGAKAIVKSDT